MRARVLAGVLLLSAAASGCNKGEVETQIGDGSTSKKDRPLSLERSTPRELGLDQSRPSDRAKDAPGPPPGDPCSAGQCPKGLICGVDLICRRPCTQTDCNERAAECAADEMCGWATSFSGACYKATARVLDPCTSQTRCAAGTVCETIGSSAARCLKLCKDGCGPNINCVTGALGCKVCAE
jgi:hypothetical protein